MREYAKKRETRKKQKSRSKSPAHTSPWISHHRVAGTTSQPAPSTNQPTPQWYPGAGGFSVEEAVDAGVTHETAMAHGLEMLMKLADSGSDNHALVLMKQLDAQTLVDESQRTGSAPKAFAFARSSWNTDSFWKSLENAAVRAINNEDFFTADNYIKTTVDLLLVDLGLYMNEYPQFGRMDPVRDRSGKVADTLQVDDSDLSGFRTKLGGTARRLESVLGIYPAAIQEQARQGNKEKATWLQAKWRKLATKLTGDDNLAPFRPGPENPHPGFAWPDKPLFIFNEVADAIAINMLDMGDRHARWKLAGLSKDSASIDTFALSKDFTQSLAAPALVHPKYLLESMMDQHDFVTMLYHHKPVREKFHDRPPDMQKREDRITVWAALYESFANHGQNSDPLWATLERIEIYLQRFTRHSEFDVSDFGEVFMNRDLPISLSGRVLQDCGVYATTVASELHAVTEMLGIPDVTFMLYTVPGHVSLVISKPDSFYVVNNDQVLGPYILSGLSEEEKTNVIFQQIAIVNADGNGLDAWISPVARLDLGTSLEQSQKEFDERMWEKYTRLTSYAMKHQESSANIKNIIHGTSETLKDLHPEMVRLSQQFNKSKRTDKREILQTELINRAGQLRLLANNIDILSEGQTSLYRSREFYEMLRAGPDDPRWQAFDPTQPIPQEYLVAPLADVSDNPPGARWISYIDSRYAPLEEAIVLIPKVFDNPLEFQGHTRQSATKKADELQQQLDAPGANLTSEQQQQIRSEIDMLRGLAGALANLEFLVQAGPAILRGVKRSVPEDNP